MRLAQLAWLWLLPLPTAALAHERITTEVTYSREVVRIVRDKCLPCHDEGSKTPLTSYAAARPWAKAIRDEVLLKRMPPWPPRAGVGEFVDDRSLSPHMVDLLVAWAEGGAPEGDRADLPTGPVATPRATPIMGTILRVQRRARLAEGATILALRPLGPRGASIEVRAIDRDGAQRPLVWIPAFDPAYAYTYALRQPLVLGAGARIEVLGAQAARVDLTIKAGQAPTAGAKN